MIRGKGSKIEGFGGTASGPEPLVDGINDICKIFNRKLGNNLSSIDVLDIVNIIGSIVVAGNIRRSSQILIGDCDDKEYVNSKDWSSGLIPNWRANSNNSILCNDINNLDDDYWNSFYRDGEVFGLINLDLCKKMGRTKDGYNMYPDPDVEGVNPGGEIPLENGSVCCLSEIFLCNIDSFEELKDVATILYKICKNSLRLPCHQKITEDIVHKNMRIGIGLTGIMQSTEEQMSWIDPLYNYLRKFDIEFF